MPGNVGDLGLSRLKNGLSRFPARMPLAVLICCAVLWALAGPVRADLSSHPLAPPNTSSPGATIKTFLAEMNDAVRAHMGGENKKARAHVTRAMRCLSLAEEPPAIKYVMGFCSALYLKEILDRIEIPPFDEIPDKKALEIQKTSSWTLPETEITVALVKDESGIERFLFTPDTVKNAELFYSRVKQLPYKPGCVGTMYEQLSASAGLIFPTKMFEHLPSWATVAVYGQAVWKWIGLVLVFSVGVGAIFLVHRLGCAALAALDKKTGWNLRSVLGGLILPVALVLLSQIGLRFTVYGLHMFQSDIYMPVAFTFLSVCYAGAIWLIGAVLSRTATVVIALGGFEASSMHAPLIRFGFDVITVVVVIVTSLSLGARLGLPTYSLVAGLGIGGLAVALAGRETLSNLIGTVMILVDQPFRLGDFVVLGEGDRGTVTDIGLRSTRIRTRDGVLVSIPNSSVATMKIVNESAPVSEYRIRLPVGVSYGSRVEDVDQALLAACKQCEHVASDMAPSARLVKFGDSALEFELFVWIERPEFRERAINQLNRAICEEFRIRGIEIPFPQRDIRIRTDTPAKAQPEN